MKAMLIWSDGTNISTHIFEDKDGKTGYELAVEHMHKEYDDHNWRDSAKEEFGAFRGDSSCCYSAEDEDMCFWQVEELPEEISPVIPNILSQSDRCELFGILIDVVEDFLEEKGVTHDMIPNEERESEDSAIIYGSDYDYLADRFSAILGIERDEPEDSQYSAREIANMLPDEVLEAAYRKRELQYRIQDAKNHAEELGYEISDEDAESIARRFLVIQDCNVAENDVFEEIVEVYVNKGKIWDDKGEIPLPESLFDTPDFDNER